MSRTRVAALLATVLLLGMLVYLGTSDLAMPGADERVSGIAEQYAREVGAGPRDPYINTDRGDLLLFVFALGGAVAGFWLGYAWRGMFGPAGGAAHGGPGGERDV